MPRIGGVHEVGAVTDELGRRGVAVEQRGADTVRQLVFDPDTGLLVAEREVLKERVGYVDAPPGTAIGERLVLRQPVVGAVGRRP